MIIPVSDRNKSTFVLPHKVRRKIAVNIGRSCKCTTIVFLVVILGGFAEFIQSYGSAVSLSTSTSVRYTTEVYPTTSIVVQNRIDGGQFSIEMTPVWYELRDLGRWRGDWVLRYYPKEVVLTWRITNVSNKRMSNITVAMRFLHSGNWTQPIIMSAGDLEPSESTFFTRRSKIEVQLDETSEPYFYYVAASVATSATTTRALTSLYISTIVLTSTSYTATTGSLQGEAASITWMLVVFSLTLIAVASAVVVYLKRNARTRSSN